MVPALPALLALCPQQLLYPCVVLEGNKSNQVSEKPWDSRADVIPSLSVFACMGLEFLLRMIPLTDFSCPVILPRDLLTLVRIFFFFLNLYTGES